MGDRPQDISSKAAPATSPGRLLSQPSLLVHRVLKETDLSVSQRLDWDTALVDLPLDDSAALTRARGLTEWLTSSYVSKSSATYDAGGLPDVPFVLVFDQPRASDGTSDAPSDADMAELLVFAQTEILNAKVAILPCDGGYFSDLTDPRILMLSGDTNLYRVLEQATAVYTHSAGFGVDAILAGHRPRVFGRPWYGGLGLTQDENPNPYLTRQLTRAQLVLAAVLEGLSWTSDGAPIRLEEVLARLQARDRAHLEDSPGYVASNILPWKRRFLRQYIGGQHLDITDDPEKIAEAKAAGFRHVIWGHSESGDVRIEDGFLRSRGLGAALVRPMSLVFDDLGMYFDPKRASRLEQIISDRATLSLHEEDRISRLLSQIKELHLSKYNVGKTTPDLPSDLSDAPRILVAGQVEDDASLRHGAGDITTNRALLLAARAAHPEACLIYKPHPDVEAGLRKGRVEDAETIADSVARNADPLDLIDACDRVWTMTSLIGFEALIRDTPVTCVGTPFYAGWGLTTDLGPVPARRAARPTLAGLAHATLIDYPRYFDPRTGAPLSPEEAVALLAQAPQGRSKLVQMGLAKLRQARAALLGLR